jgi:hypothetical protein
MKTYTNLDTLSEAWPILSELGIAGMITGDTAAFEIGTLLDKLLAQKKLQEFLCVITHEEPSAIGELGMKESLSLLTDFFVNVRNDFDGLAGLTKEVGAQTVASGKKQTKKNG